MEPLAKMTKKELRELRKQLHVQYKESQGKGSKLDMSRGKPSTEQLDLSMGMMDVFSSEDDLTCDDGTDCHNYGALDGIKEAQEPPADTTGVTPNHIIIYGNPSLNVIYDTVARSVTSDVIGGTPWDKLDKMKLLCLVPRYDRHFTITEYLGIEMVNVPMTPTGPDMDTVEELVANDDTIRGIRCVSKCPNPQGTSCPDDTVYRFARLEPAAPDSRIYWGNAHTTHHLHNHDQDHLTKILAECRRAGNLDMVYKFASTFKVSFPGSGTAAIAASQGNLEDIKKQMKIQTVGHDKANQLHHVRLFGDIRSMVKHMERRVDIMRPKFEAVVSILERELGRLSVDTWTNPKDRYFIPFDSLDGCTKTIVARCKKVRLVTAGAGITYPYGKNPHDSNIRTAPFYPPLSDLILAMESFVPYVKIVSIDKLLTEMSSQQQRN